MIYNIDFNIAGILISVVYYVFLKIQYSYESKSNRRFKIIVLTLFFANLFDMLTAITISYPSSVPLWLNYLVNIIYYILAVFCSLQVGEYVCLIIDKDGKPIIWDKINRGLVVIYSLLVVTSPVSHFLFYFDENLEYHHGTIYNFLFLLPILFMVYGLVRILVNKNKVPAKAFWAIISFISITLIGVIVQIILSSYLLSYFSASVAALIILFALETPDYVKLTETMQELENSRRKLERLKVRDDERSRTINSMMQVASWGLYFDSNGQIIDGLWSDEFFHMLGYKREDFDDEAYDLWGNSLHPDDKEESLKAFQDGLVGVKEYNQNFRLKNKDGEYHWYRGSGELVYDENGIVKSYQGYIQNIDIEVAHTKLAQDRAETLIELEKSQDMLKEAVAEAEQANRAKSQFLSNMSHDIRTPMNAIVGFTDLAIESIDDSELVKDYLKRIQVSSNHLLMLINDILDMSRIESGKVALKPEKVDLCELIDNMKDMFKKDADTHELEYIQDVDGISDRIVMCDKLRLNQVLMNCMGNSIKFTPAGGSVKICVKQDFESNIYHFTISDTGIGMNKEFIKHIFEPFERERTSTISKTEGTGLGMSITKSVVDMMDGKIWIESERGVGTTYFIDLPFEICSLDDLNNDISKEEKEEATFEEKAEFLKGKHFLLVDDNKTNRMVAKGVLGFYGMTIEEAEDGNQAIELYTNAMPDQFDLILMDIQMPVMGGYETADYIKNMSDVKKAAIPILAMTANAFEEDKKQCLEHGMVGHIAKPFKKEEIIEILYSVLAK